jgi:hypothetical protein
VSAFHNRERPLDPLTARLKSDTPPLACRGVTSPEGHPALCRHPTFLRWTPHATHPPLPNRDMSIPSDPSIRVVAVSWFREEDYPALLRIFDDADKMPRSWKEWLKGAEEMEQSAKSSGYTVERVYIDPDTFPEWCGATGVSVDRNGRHRFNAATVALKYRNQS